MALARPRSPARSRLSLSKTISWAAAGLLVAAFLSVDPYTSNPDIARWIVVSLLAGVAMVRWAVGAYKSGLYIRTHNLLALAFCSYAALTLMWSPDPKEGALRVAKLLAMWVVFVFAQKLPKTVVCRAVAVAVCLSHVSYVFWPELWGLFGNENFQAEYLLIAMPFCLFGGVMGLLAITGSVYWLVFVSVSDTPAAVLAFTLALGAGWYVIKKRQWFIGCLLVLVPLNVAVLTGWGLRYELARAVVNRLELGFNTIIVWLQNPVIGNGAGSFNYLYPQFQESHLRLFPWADTTLHPATVFSGAAHNEYLQALSDYGVVGVLIIGLTLFSIVRQSWGRKVSWETRVGWASLVPLAATCGTAFPLQNPATALLGLLALAFIASPDPAGFREYPRLRLRFLPSGALERLAR